MLLIEKEVFMKFAFKLFSLIIVLLVVSGCNTIITPAATVTDIEIIGDSSFDEHFQLADLSVKIYWSDGTSTIVPLEATMVSSTDLDKFSEEGVHSIQVQYLGQTTTFEITVRGEPGSDGREILLRVSDDYIQWQYEGETTWQNLIALADLRPTSSDPLLSISEDGFWVIDGVKTEYRAESVIEMVSVQFDVNGGVMPQDSPLLIENIAKGNAIDLPEPTREGYSFVGWFTGLSINDGQLFNASPIVKDLHLYARWSIIDDETNELIRTINIALSNMLSYLDDKKMTATQGSIDAMENIYSQYTELINTAATIESVATIQAQYETEVDGAYELFIAPTYSTIEQVKTMIDHQTTGVPVEFVGTVIGFDSMGYAHVADETGAIYVRAIHPLLELNGTVKISGVGFVYRGTTFYPEYTRQIQADGMIIESYIGSVMPPMAPQVVTHDDLISAKTDYTQSAYHGNLVTITGTVSTGSTKYLFYLLTDDQMTVGIHHYSSNFNNQITDSSQNAFLLLNGKEVTLTGILYRYYTAEDIWTFQSIGLENELIVHDEDINDPEDTVNIFSINDTHGAFYSDEAITGLDRVQTLIQGLEDHNGPYIKIANGDILQGGYVSNIHYGLPFIHVLNAMQFDAFVIGNHEFDWGIDKVAQYADGNFANGEANFPFLAANIVTTSDGEKLPWTQDYVIVENNGYKVGIIGIIGQSLTSSIAADKIAGYSFLDPYSIVYDLAGELRTVYECDVVVVATHDYSQATNYQYADFTGDHRIDAVLCAHTHQRISETIERYDGYNIPVVQAEAKNQTVGTIRLSMHNQQAISGSITHLNPSEYTLDSTIMTVINQYETDINEANRVIGYTVEHLGNYRLGTIATDAIKEMFEADAAIINTGGVRANISIGNIAIKHVYEVFPFDNEILLIQISGSQLKSFYSNNSGYLYIDSGYSASQFVDTQIYTLAVIDYVFYSGYYQSYFSSITPLQTSTYIRDAVISHIEDFYGS